LVAWELVNAIPLRSAHSKLQAGIPLEKIRRPCYSYRMAAA
jgi:hypothetical protein